MKNKIKTKKKKTDWETIIFAVITICLWIVVIKLVIMELSK